VCIINIEESDSCVAQFVPDSPHLWRATAEHISSVARRNTTIQFPLNLVVVRVVNDSSLDSSISPREWSVAAGTVHLVAARDLVDRCGACRTRLCVISK